MAQKEFEYKTKTNEKQAKDYPNRFQKVIRIILESLNKPEQ